MYNNILDTNYFYSIIPSSVFHAVVRSSIHWNYYIVPINQFLSYIHLSLSFQCLQYKSIDFYTCTVKHFTSFLSHL
jgi:hypothetical protein